MQIHSRSTNINDINALRHLCPVKPEMAAIFVRKSSPSASDVAVMRETGELFQRLKAVFFTKICLYVCINCDYQELCKSCEILAFVCYIFLVKSVQNLYIKPKQSTINSIRRLKSLVLNRFQFFWRETKRTTFNFYHPCHICQKFGAVCRKIATFVSPQTFRTGDAADITCRRCSML